MHNDDVDKLVTEEYRYMNQYVDDSDFLTYENTSYTIAHIKIPDTNLTLLEFSTYIKSEVKQKRMVQLIGGIYYSDESAQESCLPQFKNSVLLDRNIFKIISDQVFCMVPDGDSKASYKI